MAERKISVRKTPLSNYKFSAKAGETVARVSGSYQDDFTGWQGRCPLFNSAHPLHSTFRLAEIEGGQVDGGLITVNLVYENSAATAEYPGREASENKVYRYDFEIPETEEHILTNARYESLDDAERIALLNLCNGQETKEDGDPWEDDVTSDLGLDALAKIRKGQTHYMEPTFIWIQRFTTEDLEDIEIAKSSEIMDPPGPRPAPGDDRNYRYLGSTGRNSEDGESWDVERRWQLSGKGKWSDIYDPEWTLEG